VRKIAVIFLAIVISAGALNLACNRGGNSNASKSSGSNEPSGTVKIEEFKLDQQRKDGSKLRLNAQTARLFVGEDRAELEEADMVFYLKDGHQVSGHAQKGIVNTKSGASQAQGDVVIHMDNGFWFLSDFLTYDPDQKKIYAKGEFIAFGPELVVTGKDLVLDINAETFESNGPVIAQIWDFSALKKRVE